jgi:peptidoglycan/LPS O-acetylase OafA/YrhL
MAFLSNCAGLRNMHSAYRSDIDGLRAVAVLAVVLHHMSATRILKKEIENGSFSVLAFHGRQIRRLFPGAATVLPVLGGMLRIHGGRYERIWATRLLQLRPLVYVGLISYSLYLWHWPLIVFTRFAIGLGLLRPWILALPVASFLISSLSYRLVEQPFRRHLRYISQ